MSNICHNCAFHELCLVYRYNNVKTSYMLNVNRETNKDGNIVIYVDECENFMNRRFKYSIEVLKILKKEKKIPKSIDSNINNC